MPFMAYLHRLDARKNLDVFGRLYCLAGDISHINLASTPAMVFNKTLFRNLSIEFPYQDVLDGRWTIDKCFSISKEFMQDLDGDGKMSENSDLFGMDITNPWGYATSVLYCG